MELSKSLSSILIILSLVMLIWAPTSGATSLSISGIFLGEPDVFVPGVGLSMELPITCPLGLFAGMALFISGSWDLTADLVWHPSPQLELYMQALFLFYF